MQSSEDVRVLLMARLPAFIAAAAISLSPACGGSMRITLVAGGFALERDSALATLSTTASSPNAQPPAGGGDGSSVTVLVTPAEADSIWMLAEREGLLRLGNAPPSWFRPLAPGQLGGEVIRAIADGTTLVDLARSDAMLVADHRQPVIRITAALAELHRLRTVEILVPKRILLVLTRGQKDTAEEQLKLRVEGGGAEILLTGRDGSVNRRTLSADRISALWREQLRAAMFDANWSGRGPSVPGTRSRIEAEIEGVKRLEREVSSPSPAFDSLWGALVGALGSK